MKFWNQCRALLGGYICFFQRFEISFMRPLEYCICSQWNHCASREYINVRCNVILPVPSWKDISRCILESWIIITENKIWKTFNQVSVLESSPFAIFDCSSWWKPFRVMTITDLLTILMLITITIRLDEPSMFCTTFCSALWVAHLWFGGCRKYLYVLAIDWNISIFNPAYCIGLEESWNWAYFFSFFYG